MFKIYRRYNTVPNHSPQKPSPPVQQPTYPSTDITAKAASAPKPQHLSQNNKPKQQPNENAKSAQADFHPRKEPSKQKDANRAPYGPLLGLIPRHIYNPDSKKILGFLSSEDLLLIALIFLFLESSEEDNPLMVLALVYVLLGEYIDFGDFAF